MSATSRTQPARRRVQFSAAAGALHDVLCAVDGSRLGFEAVTQAAMLLGPDARMSLLSVPWRPGVGVTEMTDLTPARAQHALDHARALARDQGLDVREELLETAREGAAEVIVARAAEHRLLALGAPSVSRARGIFLGSVASTAAHLLPASLLLARRAPGRFAFPQRILIASDGTPESDAVVHVAAEVARRCEARVTLLHATGHEGVDERQHCSHQAVDLFEAMDVEPVFRSERGRAQDVLLEAARREESSLIVMGSRRLSGARALGSVSERVAHRAPCSVLVLRPEDMEPTA